MNIITAALITIALADTDPGLCPQGSECEDNRIDRAMARAENAGKTAARQAHPGTPIGLVSVDCAYSGSGSAGIFSCTVTIDLPLIAVDFDCDVGVNDSGVQYIECRDR